MDFPYLERLTRAECQRLLPSAAVGRLAVPTAHFPTLEPVSFAVIEGELVVAVRPGSAGDALAAGTVVTFEADVLDHDVRQGWSVAVGGPVEDLDADVASLVRPLLGPWPVPESDRLLLIRADRVTGQRVVNGPETAAVSAVGARKPGPEAAGRDATVVARRSIGTDEALTLLARGGQHVGRLVVTLGGDPAVYPLNYAVDGDAIVFRTQVGTKLSGITRSMVAFEVDCIDESGQGWSVAFEGLAQEVLEADPAGLHARMAGLALDTWPGGERHHVVRITPYRVHGTAWTAAVPTGATAAPASAAPPAV